MQQGTVSAAVDKNGIAGRVDVAAYVRVSTTEQRGRFGVPVQVAAIKAIVERRSSWHFVACREDLGESGSSHTRPGFDALVEDVSAGRVNLVLVHRLDRLGRTEAAIWRCLWQIEDVGGQVECCAEPLGGPGIERWLTIDRLARAVEEDYRRIRARTQAGRQLKAVEGGWPGGPAPYGYRISGKGAFGSTLEVDPAEARVVRLIVDLVIGGVRGITELAGELNKRGAFTRTGRCWTPSNLHRRLKSGTFLGSVVFRRADQQWGDHCTRLGTDGKPLFGDSVVIPLPPIVAADRIEAFQDALTELVRSNKSATSADYPLSGRVHGPCGLPYIGCLRSKDGLRTYRCSGWERAVACGCAFLPAHVVEEQVADHVNALLASVPPAHRPTPSFSRVTPTSPARHVERVEALERISRQYRDELDRLRTRVQVDLVVRAGARQLESDLNALDRILGHARDWLHELEQGDRGAWLRTFLASSSPDIRTLLSCEQRRVAELVDVRVDIVDSRFRYREGTRCSTTLWHERTGTLIPPSPDDGQWEQIQQLLHCRYSAHHFRSPLDLRAALEGMLHRLRTGIRWRDLPARFGESERVRLRQSTWLADGVWADIVEFLGKAAEGTTVVGYRAAPALLIRTVLDTPAVR
ncbi:recombinase family protein [Streptomyces sp. CA-249302]|uniref:recombinase family protein n=1 Tax=Streptomyces sp. CA-249302 TaxID=3240058 RepID=UPI003D908ECB